MSKTLRNGEGKRLLDLSSRGKGHVQKRSGGAMKDQRKSVKWRKDSRASWGE